MTDSIEELATKLEALVARTVPWSHAGACLAMTQAVSKLRECREALGPLAEAGKCKLCGGDFWTDDKSIQGTDVAFHVRFGDLRRAAKALEAK